MTGTFKCVAPSLVKEVFLVAIVRYVTYAFLLNLTKRKDLKVTMKGFEDMIISCFMRRIVDPSDCLIALREDWGILGYFLSFCDANGRQIVLG